MNEKKLGCFHSAFILSLIVIMTTVLLIVLFPKTKTIKVITRTGEQTRLIENVKDYTYDDGRLQWEDSKGFKQMIYLDNTQIVIVEGSK